MLYFNIPEPYETALQRLKAHYAIKANQGMVEFLIRSEAMRLELWEPVTHPAEVIQDHSEAEAQPTAAD